MFIERLRKTSINIALVTERGTGVETNAGKVAAHSFDQLFISASIPATVQSLHGDGIIHKPLRECVPETGIAMIWPQTRYQNLELNDDGMSQTPQALSQLAIYLFGQARMQVDGRLIEERLWTRRKSKSLVKILALSPNHQLHREQLMELLWPEAEPELAANNLHKALHAARRVLEPELKAGPDSAFLLTLDQMICLRAPELLWIDAEEFRRLADIALRQQEIDAHRAALGLYTGELLEEDRYEDWAATSREQLHLLAQKLIASLARLYESAGNLTQAIENYRRLLEFDKLNEEAHRNLMRTYSLAGQRSLALQQFQACRLILQNELQAAPESATLRLHERILSGDLQTALDDKQAEAPLQETDVAGKAKPTRRSLPKGRIYLTISLIVLIVLTLVFFQNEKKPAQDSIAVLPFTNATGDAEVDYLSDGLSESLINSLSQIPNLRVIARTTAFRYKSSMTDPVAAGRQMTVDNVITGKLTRQGDEYVVQADLVRVNDGAQIWGQQYHRRFSDLVTLQSEIAREISQRLRAQLSVEQQGRIAHQHTTNASAYQSYLKGRYYWNLRKVTDVERAVEHFKEAIARDPGYALAYAGLADCYHTLSNLKLSPTEAIPLARHAANKALEIDERVAGAHASLAIEKWRFDWDWPGAEREFLRAIELDPNYAPAHQWYGQFLTYQKKFGPGLAELKKAQQIDPLSPIITANIGLPLYFSGDYDGAIAQFNRAFEFQKDFPFGHFFIGWALVQKKEYPEAIAQFQQAVDADATPGALAYLGYGHAVAGNPAESEKILRRLQDLSRTRYVSPYYLAVVCTGLGQDGMALGYLSQALDDHSDPMVLIGVEPKFDRLRTTPQFQELLRRVGLAK
jgi:DNA-binding SARP family transcriptional activator/TolB-like protein